MRSYLQEKEVNPLAYTITEECINCGACDDSCPLGAISEQGDVRVIDADACTDCGACVDCCPRRCHQGSLKNKRATGTTCLRRSCFNH
ncbi:MAG: 4Fe-4S binding protein [Syntrophotaleaceae bacterium]